MTTEQTFFLILSVFYLLNMVRAAKQDSVVIQNKLIKGWKLSHPSIFLGGIQKSLCITHLLPVHSYTIFSALGGNTTPEDKQLITRSKNVKKLICIVANSASTIRMFSFITFYLYFLVIPVAYVKFGDTFPTYIVILVALIMPIITGIVFVCNHRKLAPEQKEIRWKHFLYCILIPWHAMRVADYIFLAPQLEKIHPLSFVALCSNEEADNYLSQEFRNTIHLSDNLYSKQEFEKFFILNDINSSLYLKPPSQADPSETQFCPCCHTLFTDQVNQCSDCESLRLVPVKTVA